MRDVDGQTNVGKVEAVAQGDQGQADNVVADELLEVFAGLLHAQEQDDGLLGPVGGLEQVVELEVGLVGLVGEGLVHAVRVEVPDGGAAHDVHAGGTQDAKVDGRVHLLHVAGLLAARLEAVPLGHRTQDLLHDELAREGQDDGVEGDEGDVPETLAILGDFVGARDGQLVRQEDEVVDRVALGRVERVEREEDEQDDGGQDPGVLQGVEFCASQHGTGFPSFG